MRYLFKFKALLYFEMARRGTVERALSKKFIFVVAKLKLVVKF